MAFEHDNLSAAQEVLDMEESLIGGMEKLRRDRQNQLLQENHTSQEMAAFTFETDVMENFKRIYQHLQRWRGWYCTKKDPGRTGHTITNPGRPTHSAHYGRNGSDGDFHHPWVSDHATRETERRLWALVVWAVGLLAVYLGSVALPWIIFIWEDHPSGW